MFNLKENQKSTLQNQWLQNMLYEFHIKFKGIVHPKI